MIKTLPSFLSLLGLVSCFNGCAQTVAHAPANPRLARLVDSLDRNDQRPFELAMRGELRQDSATVQSRRIYRQNYPQLQRIIREYGYPGFALVDPETTKHFNNMVLHCFFDVPFQNKVLELFTKEGQTHPALLADKGYLRDLAYLTDKVKVNSGQPQVYGTQLDYNDQGPFLRPSIDLPNLDKRRQKMQLEPAADYLKKAVAQHEQMKQMNQKSRPQPALNLRLKRELDSLLVSDQVLRQILFDKSKARQRDSVIVANHFNKEDADMQLSRLMIQTDSSNLTRIRAIIAQYGYPGKSLVGPDTNEAAFYVIQHSTRLAQYFPLIKQAAEQGELPFVRYAMMLDRKLMQEEKPQVYGTQGRGFNSVNKATGKPEWTSFIWPIQDPAQVNERRKKAGFPDTVEEHAKEMGMTYRVLTLDEVRKMPGYRK